MQNCSHHGPRELGGATIGKNIVRSSHFGQSYGPWTSKNCNNLQFPFIFFALDARIEMIQKFDTQIYHENI
jgi:hypothetical protein